MTHAINVSHLIIKNCQLVCPCLALQYRNMENGIILCARAEVRKDFRPVWNVLDRGKIIAC